MISSSYDRRALWQYSHSASILFAALLFTAGFLCTLLWTNNLVQTESSTGGATPATLNRFSPAVSTFSTTYGVALFGTIWNSIIFVALLIVERDELPIPTTRLRYEVEKAACVVAFVGNAIYSIACIALMATLARLAADAKMSNPNIEDVATRLRIAGDANARRAGQGATAAFAGLAAAAAVWACVMDLLHAQGSSYRRSVKSAADFQTPLRVESNNGPDAADKQA
ncbi:hypothetical protein E8E12_002656 [Didymella heteroderae]|uniref:Uncharacterized protein n=1 Tax=Didymella heteroderae TaxID=1769908 RepID=A0A9P5C5M2_9PLEO|nr:hypothetical protein E8E12_002656 [Didymella heteroderae]